MKAVIYDTYGSPDVLEVTEIGQPEVRDDQVLVRVRAASVNPADWHFMRGLPYLVRMINGLRRPRKATVLGSDLAGQVEAVGKNVTRFRPGDEVFGRTRAAHRPDRRAEVATGSCAEYACVCDDLLGLKPANLTFEQAAAVPLAALTALQALRDRGSVLSPFVSQRLRQFLTKWSEQDLHAVRDLIEAGQVTPVIDQTYPLSQAREAMRYLELGHARGKIVIIV
jgi:NADPH:quinone reductase-like Zn-dependent oxidoreductase